MMLPQNYSKNVVAKGTIYLMLAQFLAVFAGYIIHVFLARSLGPVEYGNFGIILSLILILKTLFLTGTTKAIAKYVAEYKDNISGVLTAGLKVQFFFMIACVALFSLFSGYLAAFLHEPGLKMLILFASLAVLSLGFYLICVDGYFNGKRQFIAQSWSEAAHSVLRIILAFSFIYLGYGIYGATAAYIIAPLIVVLFVWKCLPLKEGNNFSVKTMLQFALPTTLFYFLFIFTTDISLFLVKRIMEDQFTGFYTSALTISKISLSIFSALPLTMMPSISAAYAEKKLSLVQKYVKLSLRYALILLLPAAVLISVYARPIIELLYSSTYAPGAGALKILIFAFSLYSLFMVLCSFLSGIDKPIVVLIVSLITTIFGLILTLFLIPPYGLIGAAAAALITALFGTILVSWFVYKTFNALVDFWSIIRILFVCGIIYVISLLFPVQGLWFIIAAILLGILYILLLILVKELKQEDWELVKSILTKR